MGPWLHFVTHPAYLIACLVVAILGRKRRSGLLGYFFLSFLLTPLVMLFVLYVGAEPAEPTAEELKAEAETLARKAEKAAERARAKADQL